MYGCISSNFSLISSTNLKGQLIFITGYTLGWIGWPSPAYPTTWLVWFVAGHLFHISLIFCYSFKSNSISHTIHQLVIALVVSRPATIAFHLTATWLSIGLSWLVAGHLTLAANPTPNGGKRFPVGEPIGGQSRLGLPISNPT